MAAAEKLSQVTLSEAPEWCLENRSSWEVLKRGLLTARLQRTYSDPCLYNSVQFLATSSKEATGRFDKDVWKHRERAPSTSANPPRPAVPHFDMCLRYIRSTCPGSLGEDQDEAFCIWQHSGCRNSTTSSLWLGNGWTASTPAVRVGSVSVFQGSCCMELFCLSPFFLYPRMTSFKEKVHCSNWIFPILKGVKINILLGLFRHTLESPKCDSWKERHDISQNESKVLISYFFPADLGRGKRLQNLNARLSSRKPGLCAAVLISLAFCWLIVHSTFCSPG